MIATKYKLLYSETSRKQIRRLHPDLKPILKEKIEQIGQNPFLGKLLEKEISNYLSFRAKRFRLFYMIMEEQLIIEIHYVGHRKDIYTLFSEYIEK